MTGELNQVIVQRLREAARAHAAGQAVTFEREEGGAGIQLVAYYRSTRHPVFTSGADGAAFEALRAQCLREFEAMKKEVVK